MRNKTVDYWRKRKITLNLDEALTLIDALEQHQVKNTIDDQQLYNEMMDTLPAEIRALFILRYVDDLTYQEIADCIGKNPATIRKIFSDMHKKLRIQFQESFDPQTI